MSAVDTWTAPLTKSGEMEKRNSQRISPSLGGLGNFNESLGNDLLVIQVEEIDDFFLQVDLPRSQGFPTCISQWKQGNQPMKGLENHLEFVEFETGCNTVDGSEIRLTTWDV